MEEILDEGMKILYTTVRQSEDAEAGYDQKEAVRQIKRLAQEGNTDAIIAMERLRNAPELHPFLKEILYA